MSEYIAAKTAEDATGADFTVTDTVGVSCYGANGNEHVGTIMEKNSDGTYEPLMASLSPDKAPVQVALMGADRRTFSITKKGTYKIIKHATVGTAGIDLVS